MRSSISFVLLALLVALVAARDASAKDKGPAAVVGSAAPDFELTDTDGNKVKLSSFAGKVVVLEWFNPDCPFVKYAHGEGPLKDMAARWSKKGVVWLAINSGAPGKQGHGKDRNATARKDWSLAHPVLLDESGAVGKIYSAKTTPHMYVIDPKGNLVYAGGLDNAPMGRAEGDKPIRYVDQALEAVTGSKAVEVKETKPYGCSVKYGS